jgi:hypothetical protein
MHQGNRGHLHSEIETRRTEESRVRIKDREARRLPVCNSCLTGKSVKSCPAPSNKIFLFSGDPKSVQNSRHPVPLRGALAIVTNVGAGCGGRGSVRRAAGLRGGLWPVSDQRHADDRCCCVRQNRVVLAPVAGVKLAEMLRTQPGLAGSLIRQRRRQDEFVSGESTA